MQSVFVIITKLIASKNYFCKEVICNNFGSDGKVKNWKKGKDPHPQDKIQQLDFTKDPRPFYYKTLPCAFYHKNVRSKAVFGP